MLAQPSSGARRGLRLDWLLEREGGWRWPALSAWPCRGWPWAASTEVMLGPSKRPAAMMAPAAGLLPPSRLVLLEALAGKGARLGQVVPEPAPSGTAAGTLSSTGRVPAADPTACCCLGEMYGSRKAGTSWLALAVRRARAALAPAAVPQPVVAAVASSMPTLVVCLGEASRLVLEPAREASGERVGCMGKMMASCQANAFRWDQHCLPHGHSLTGVPEELRRCGRKHLTWIGSVAPALSL
jgi:hypothetical protein